ncbi:hypothetical protein KUTeg_008152 [Tegillarca granosa]|uniref:Uncharacterized protein n=1 Tax=Tegillarca granosa TaxID=220873 RepID=A0ABQ9FAG4_TEGGR|nr:hypothetical protein KUTeg_008152 [Tegillarca granosa]
MGTLSGEFLPAQVIYTGKTSACHPQYKFPKSWDINHSVNHWANADTQMDYVERIILPYINKVKRRLGLPKNQSSTSVFM